MKSLRKRRLSVRTHIALLAAGLALLSMAAGTAVVAYYAMQSAEAELGRRALTIGRTMAEMTDVKRQVGQPDGSAVIQPIAERIRMANGAAYVVVLDMAHRRLSHPVESRIGTMFEGEDAGPAFAEHTYISKARGVQGNSIRAFVPVMATDLSEQVGVVVVGLLSPTIGSVLLSLKEQILLALAAAMLVGVTGAWYLGGRIKRALLGLEPVEIARLLQERAAILDGLGEGILAIDREQRITVLNPAARRMIGVADDALGRKVTELIPHTRLPQIMATGEPEYNQEMLLGDTIVLTNRVPVRIGGEMIGAVATFRDRTELHRLAEELTGVTKFVDSLRAQNHEHMNRLHTIAGLIQLGRYQAAIDYVFSSFEQQQEEARFLARSFTDYRIGGLLLGKLSRARELGIQLTIDPSSHLEQLPPRLDGGALAVVIGNLLENALEAVSTLEAERRRVVCLIRQEPDAVRLVIEDRGPGIPEELRAQIWLPGFTTKAGANRGIGLALVRRHLETVAGHIDLESGPDGTRFTVLIPYPAAPAADESADGGAFV